MSRDEGKQGKQERKRAKTANIVLDLDQTLISAIEPEDAKKLPKLKGIKSSKMGKDYVVYHRPHLQQLLTYIFSHFNVGVWTAATQDYALFIVEHIILKGHPERKLDFVLSEEQCKLSDKKYKSPKDLRLLWDYLGIENYYPDNTFILDDNGDVFLPQLKNSLPITPFNIDENPDDTELKRLVTKLKKAKAAYDSGIKGNKKAHIVSDHLHTKRKTHHIINKAIDESRR